jgi:hypothetical protein
MSDAHGVSAPSMPREQIRADGHDRRRSLGHLANAWIEHFVVHGPGDVQGVPVVLVQEFYDFHVDAMRSATRRRTTTCCTTRRSSRARRAATSRARARGCRCSRRSGRAGSPAGRGRRGLPRPVGARVRVRVRAGRADGRAGHRAVHPDHGHRGGPDRQHLRRDLLQPHRRRRAAVEGAWRQGGVVAGRPSGRRRDHPVDGVVCVEGRRQGDVRRLRRDASVQHA